MFKNVKSLSQPEWDCKKRAAVGFVCVTVIYVIKVLKDVVQVKDTTR